MKKHEPYPIPDIARRGPHPTLLEPEVYRENHDGRQKEDGEDRPEPHAPPPGTPMGNSPGAGPRGRPGRSEASDRATPAMIRYRIRITSVTDLRASAMYSGRPIAPPDSTLRVRLIMQ